jgi:hypothetical protein
MPTIRLRDVDASDLPIFFEQQLDPIATQMAASPARYSTSSPELCSCQRPLFSPPLLISKPQRRSCSSSSSADRNHCPHLRDMCSVHE